MNTILEFAIRLNTAEAISLYRATETQMIEDSKRLEFWESVTPDKEEHVSVTEMVHYFQSRIANMKSVQAKLREYVHIS